MLCYLHLNFKLSCTTWRSSYLETNSKQLRHKNYLVEEYAEEHRNIRVAGELVE